MQHAVAGKPVVRAAWRELRVRAVAVEAAVQLAWHLAADGQMRRVALGQLRGVVATQKRFVGGEGSGDVKVLKINR